VKPRILFIHNGSAGRFRFLASAFAERKWECAHIGPPDASDLPEARNMRWRFGRGSTPNIFVPATRAEADLIRGHYAAEVARKLKEDGFIPDLIIGHPGWGEMVFLGEVFPGVKQIQIGEWYYRSTGTDFDFDPEFGLPDFADRCRGHAKNAVLALSVVEADKIVSPTQFQASTFPDILQARISVIHEGIDTDIAKPGLATSLKLPNGIELTRETPVVTLVNRRFEPIRGFHTFMRALPRFLAANPTAHVILVGFDDPDIYGARPKDHATWKAVMLAEVGEKLDHDRVHFVGRVGYDALLRLFSVTTAHVYLTYPFVLSWSLLDAMACEALVIGSDTAPVREVIRDGENGFLVDFFDHNALADKLTEVCSNPNGYDGIRRAARETVLTEFDQKTVCLPAWLKLVDDVLAG
jgi:glycosyltransferase involved in cell wall biosynthesis